MAQQQARDEAGNIWNIDEAGNPVSLAQAAPQGGASVVAPNPVQAQRQQADLGGAELGNRRTAQQIAMDAVKMQAAPQMTAEELRAIQLDNAAKEKALANPVESKQTQTDRLSRLRQLAGQINRTQSLYNTGIGTTKGIAGIKDYLPTDANARFDVAGNSLSQQGLAAFKVPGLGTVSDRDAMMFDRANLPTASTRDVAVDEQLRGIRARVDEEMRALGQKPVNWQTSIDGGTAQPQQTQGAMMVPGAGTTPPQTPQGPAGYDVGAVAGAPSGGTGGGGNFASAAGVAMAKRLSQAYTKGAGVQELNRLLSDNGFQTFSDPGTIAAIQKRGRLNFAPPVADDTRGTVGRALGGLADSAGGAYAISAADALTAGTLDTIAGGQSGLAMEYARQQYPGASLAGTVTGGALGAAGAEMGLARAGLGAGAAALGGDALYGAAYGAGSTEDGSRLLGAAGGGLGALAGGAAGRGIARGVGSAFRGVQNADAQLLRQNQIPVTVGQAMGGTAQRIENSMTSLPGVGDIVGNRYREGVAALRPAAVREAVGGVPNNITATGGREAVEQGRTAIGNAYDGALNGVDLNIDPGYKREVGSALQGASTLPGPLRDTFISTLQNRVAPQFNGQQIDGRGLQAAVQGLRKDSGDLIRRGEIQSDLFANRAGDVEEALFNLAERQAPGTQEALQAANRANRGMSIVEEASARALNNGGDFTAAQLGQAIKQNARRFNGVKAMNSGKIPLQALQEAAQRVLPSTVPDSGTTGRALVAGGLGLAGAGTVGGGAGYATDSGAGAGAGAGIGLAALLAAGGTKFGQRQLTRALLDRPEMLIRAGNGIANRARIGGLFGAPMLAGAGASLATQ